MRVDVLVPMLGRAWAVEPLVDSVTQTQEEGVDLAVVFIASESDEEVVDTLHRSGEDFIVLPGEPEPGDYARKINVGYDATEGEWMLLGASDIRFHPGWAGYAIAMGDEYQAGVVGTNDLGNPTVKVGLHSTHPLVRRTYIQEQGGGWDGPGVVYHEGYFHQYVDTELVTAAQARGQWAFCHDAQVEHLHPFWGKGKRDATYARGLAASAADARLFRSRAAKMKGGAR